MPDSGPGRHHLVRGHHRRRGLGTASRDPEHLRDQLACQFGINVLYNATSLAGPYSTSVADRNDDTLYSTVFLDLRAGPQLLRVPSMSGRYVDFQLLDKYTNTIAAAPTGAFSLVFRVYDPTPQVLDGSWSPPAIRALSWGAMVVPSFRMTSPAALAHATGNGQLLACFELRPASFRYGVIWLQDHAA